MLSLRVSLTFFGLRLPEMTRRTVPLEIISCRGSHGLIDLPRPLLDLIESSGGVYRYLPQIILHPYAFLYHDPAPSKHRQEVCTIPQ